MAQPLAGLMLDFVEKWDFSVQALFSLTSSQGSNREKANDFTNRAPITRLKLFQILSSEHPPISRKRLLELVEMNGLHAHLEELDRLGIISYTSIKPNQEIELMELIDPNKIFDIALFKHDPALVKNVYDIIFQNPEKAITISWVFDQILKNETRQGLKRESLERRVRGVLNNLTKEEYIENIGELTNENRAIIHIAP